MKYLILTLAISITAVTLVKRETYAAEICWTERDGRVTCSGETKGTTKNCYFEETRDGPILVCY